MYSDKSMKTKIWIKIGDADKNLLDFSASMAATVVNREIAEVENKIPDVSGLITESVINIKIGAVEKKYLMFGV